MDYEDIKIERLECRKCKHRWYPRVLGGTVREPKVCPSCSNRNWHEEPAKPGRPRGKVSDTAR